MRITTELLKSLNACQPGIDLVATYENKDHEAVIRQLVADGHWDWANWLLPRLMDSAGYVSYAVHAAELVFHLWEAKNPNDGRPHEAIEAAKWYIANPDKKNTDTAWSAEQAALAAEEATKVDVNTKPKIIEKGLEILRQKNKNSTPKE